MRAPYCRILNFITPIIDRYHAAGIRPYPPDKGPSPIEGPRIIALTRVNHRLSWPVGPKTQLHPLSIFGECPNSRVRRDALPTYAARRGERGVGKFPRRTSKNCVPLARRLVKLEIGPRRPPQTSQISVPPFLATLVPSPSHWAQTSTASAFITVRPCKLWYCTSYSSSPSHSSRVSASPSVPEISLVSSSSNSTTNFHLVRKASWVIPSYCIRLGKKTQDIVAKNLDTKC